MLSLEVGSRRALHVREETIGDADAGASWRLLYASDLHLLPRRRHLLDQLEAATVTTRPDAVLLGGDLVDGAQGLPVLREAVVRLRTHAAVFAVAGNHDASLGTARVRAAVLGGGGAWLHDAERRLTAPGHRDLHLHATPRAGHAARNSVRVLVTHHPKVMPAAAATGYDAVLAGHLHGGQCVWFHWRGRDYPGGWFQRWTGPRFAVANTTMLVSRGVADTLPLRFRCPREVLLCRIH